LYFIAWVIPTGSTPFDELDRVDATIAMFDLGYIRMWPLEHSSQGPLAQLGLGAQSKQSLAELPIGRSMLWACSHVGSRLR
jgi:hypothetical protein